MDSAQLYLELLDSGERVQVALAGAREANVFRAGTLSYADWKERLWEARREVECAAECYAIALRVFRAAVMAELAPSEAAESPRLGRGATHRERAGAASADCRSDGGQAVRTARKDVAAEGFPVPTRLSKIH
jgi:hypothetical protein